MENSDKETHDFMNVDTFSQLPFIRPAPVKEKGIRLFGKEFGAGAGGGTAGAGAGDEAVEQEEVKESSRKFECHYCCRNFPTSQALGGHQNAHKRERQHAKRAHLQSAMVHGGLGLTDAHVYGLMNYHRVPSLPSPINNYNYNINSNSNRFYNNGSYSQPMINGSPLGMWRIPTVQSSGSFNHERSMHQPLPLFANEESRPAGYGGSANSQSRYGYESKPSVTDQVSLDLHL